MTDAQGYALTKVETTLEVKKRQKVTKSWIHLFVDGSALLLCRLHTWLAFRAKAKMCPHCSAHRNTPNLSPAYDPHPPTQPLTDFWERKLANCHTQNGFSVCVVVAATLATPLRQHTEYIKSIKLA